MAKEGQTYRELHEALARGDIAPVYLLYGEEDFLLEEALDAIIATALAGVDRTLNLDVLHGGDADGHHIVARASSFPMTGERRVVVVRDVEKLSGRDAELLASYIEHASPSTCLVLLSVKPDFRKKPFVTARKLGVVAEFKRLYENKVPAWVSEYVRKGGRRIDAEGAKLLAAYVGSSLREIKNELDKLYIYCGERKEITENDVSALVGMSKEFSPFELQKAIGRREIARATTILSKLLDGGEGMPLIIATLTNYYLVLWKMHDMRRRGVPLKEQAAVARVNPYFLEEYQEALQLQGPADCQQAFLLLSEADEQSKSGQYDVRQVLHTMIVRLCGADVRNPAEETEV
jgi:DNA polymerase-3 subunit delta